ncbi:TetR/AcrR family transcriptional regulator [Planctomycetota bacterium]|nr:TetR/AcrR family transcriptional regulator [Planctomycetota bacterium]
MTDRTQELDTKQRILKEGAKLFAVRGYDGISVREVVEASGVKKPTLYYHFGNKEGLATEIFKQFFEEQIRIRSEVLVLKLNTAEALAVHAAKVLEWSKDNTDIILFAFSVWMGRSSLVSQQQYTHEFESTANKNWVEFLVGGGLTHEQATVARKLYWAQLMFAIVRIAKAGTFPEDSELFGRVLAKNALYGAIGK